MTDSTGNFRHPASQKSRSAILDATQAEVTRQGYEAMSIRSIARRAMVDPRLIRHYFSGKKNLVLAALDQFAMRRKSAGDSLTAATADAGGEGGRAATAQWEFVIVCALSSEPSVRDAAAALIGSALDGFAPDDAVRLMTLLLLGVLPDGSPRDGGVDADADARRTRDLLIADIRREVSALSERPW